jgi:hypothetical protein
MLGSAPGLTPAGLEAAGLFEGAPPEIQSGVLSLLRAVGKRRPGR